MTHEEDIIHLRRVVWSRLAHDPDYAEMFDAFVSGRSDLYWVYYLTRLGGTEPELTLDYSVSGGGGWLNVSYPYKDFIEAIHKLQNNSCLSDNQKIVLDEELERLDKRIREENPTKK